MTNFLLFFTPKKLKNKLKNKFARNIHRNLKLSVSNPFVKTHKMGQKKISKNSKFAILILKILEFPTGGNSIFSDLQPHRHGGNGKTNPSSCHLHWTFSYPAEYLCTQCQNSQSWNQEKTPLE